MIEIRVFRATAAGVQLDAVNAETIYSIMMWLDLKDGPLVIVSLAV